MTGINRVGLAYLEALIASDMPLYGLVNYHRGLALLDRQGVEAYAKGLSGRMPFASASWLVRIQEGGNTPRARSLNCILRHAIGRARMHDLGAVLARKLPKGCLWLSTEINNLRADLFAELRKAGLGISVMIHDTIPVDYPQFVGENDDTVFLKRLEAVSGWCDLVIYNSQYSRDRAEHYMARSGRLPAGLVAHLGAEMPRPDSAGLPHGIDFSRPTFAILGTIEPRKNHALLLDLWDRFAAERAAGDVRPMPQLLVLGKRGWLNKEVFRRLDTSPLRGKDIHEINGLQDGAVAAVLERSSALLFPSHVEGFGLPALEAALLGCPVIANDLPVYREFLHDLPTYVPISAPDLWALAIRRACLPQPKPVPAALPTWGDHFTSVFGSLNALHALS